MRERSKLIMLVIVHEDAYDNISFIYKKWMEAKTFKLWYQGILLGWCKFVVHNGCLEHLTLWCCQQGKPSSWNFGNQFSLYSLITLCFMFWKLVFTVFGSNILMNYRTLYSDLRRGNKERDHGIGLSFQTRLQYNWMILILHFPFQSWCDY